MKNKGFTLVELMIAVAILAVVLLGLLAVFTGCFMMNETAKNLTIATNGAQKKMEEIRNSTFSSIYSTYDGTPFEVDGLQNEDSEGSVKVVNTSDLLEVTVTVCWRQKGGRIIGEARDVSGGLVIVDLDEDGNITSPAQIVTLMTRR